MSCTPAPWIRTRQNYDNATSGGVPFKPFSPLALSPRSGAKVTMFFAVFPRFAPTSLPSVNRQKTRRNASSPLAVERGGAHAASVRQRRSRSILRLGVLSTGFASIAGHVEGRRVAIGGWPANKP
jgi:hypothetical protein